MAIIGQYTLLVDKNVFRVFYFGEKTLNRWNFIT